MLMEMNGVKPTVHVVICSYLIGYNYGVSENDGHEIIGKLHGFEQF
jgi:hypothetical protein